MQATAAQLQLNFAERAVKRRPVSLILAVLLASAGFTVLFVSNVIAVNNLGAQIVESSTLVQRTADENRQLQADISRLMAADRITHEAAQLGLVQSQTPGELLAPVVSGK